MSWHSDFNFFFLPTSCFGNNSNNKGQNSRCTVYVLKFTFNPTKSVLVNTIGRHTVINYKK